MKEDVYVTTKLTTEAIDLNLIEIRRYESSEWEELSARENILSRFKIWAPLHTCT